MSKENVIPVYVACIEHMTGVDLLAQFSLEELNSRIAEYCKDHWPKGKPSHEGLDDEALIDLYFDEHEDDTLTVQIYFANVRDAENNHVHHPEGA